MSEEKLKQIWDNLFNKLNETEKTYLAIISNEKNKQIEELKSQLQQKENIIKEVRKIVKWAYKEDEYQGGIYTIEQILDKVEK